MTTPSDPNQPGGYGNQPGPAGQPGQPDFGGGQPGGYGEQPGVGGQPGQPGYTGQSGLPSFPAAPPPMESQGPDLQPPAQINAAFWLYLATAVIVLVSALLVLGSRQQIVDSVRAGSTNLSPDQINQFTNAFLAVVVVIGVIIAGLLALFSFKLRAGRNWARIVMAILVVLQLLELFNSRGSSGVFTYVSVILGVIAAVLSYLPNSSAYVSAVKMRRRGM